MANITVTIRTYFEDGNYRNNTVEINIPDEAAEIISREWHAVDGPMAQRNAITSKWLSKNQEADAIMYDDDNNVMGGMSNMRTLYTLVNETITRRFDHEEFDDE